MMIEGKILIDRSLNWLDTQWHRFAAVAPASQFLVVDTQDDAAVSAALQTTEVAILSGDLDERFLHAPKIKWIHCDHAGLTKSAVPVVFDRNLIVTGSAGRSGPALAEHVMMFALMLSSEYPAFYDAQRNGEWLRTERMTNLRALSGRTIGILGMGQTGIALAQRSKAFDMRVLGYRRRDTHPPPNVDILYSSDRGETIDTLLEQADVLALVLNLSDATYHMISHREFAKMKSGAILINLSRGDVIDQEALISAMESGHLAGAGLDVTTPEPLPKEHRLWKIPNVLITPHFTPSLPDKASRSVDIILENFQSYSVGSQMKNQITKEDIWTH